ncbi:DUF5522 domain-containing protein [Lacihabitans lacunae]|uniref:DUF5522 domain-containing protein n=1 Tax=Lacihabitans lacunae TaxID=1028214 RepID=A0ABV7YP21_9BACT
MEKAEKKIINNKKSNPDFYFNNQGFMVFTREYHLKRGYCCKNKCLNCPFDSENIK